MPHHRDTVKPLLLCSDFRQQRSPKAGQSLLIDPTIEVFDIQIVNEGHQNAGDVSQVFCLQAEAVIPWFIDDEIFRRIEVDFAQRLSPNPSGDCASGHIRNTHSRLQGSSHYCSAKGLCFVHDTTA